MNLHVKNKCDKLIKLSKDNKILYEEVINELSKNKTLMSYSTTIPNALNYLEANGIVVIHNENNNSEDEILTDEQLNTLDEYITNIDDDNYEENTEETTLITTNNDVVMTDSVAAYLKSVGQISNTLLTADEEKYYITKAQNGDEEARKLVVERNLRLVINIASKYKKVCIKSSVNFEDLIQYGNIGLMSAVDKFNPKLGFKFSTYATWWIKQALFRGIGNDGRNIRLPVYIIEQLRYIYKAIHELDIENKQLNNEDYKNIAKYCNKHGLLTSQYKDTSKHSIKFDAERVRKFLMYDTMTSDISIYTVIGEDEDSSLIDFIGDENVNIEKTAEQSNLAEIMNSVFEKHLSPKEADVLRLRYGFNGHPKQTLQEIGDKYGVSRERIRQIESKAKDKLRNSRKIKQCFANYYTEKAINNE